MAQKWSIVSYKEFLSELQINKFIPQQKGELAKSKLSLSSPSYRVDSNTNKIRGLSVVGAGLEPAKNML